MNQQTGAAGNVFIYSNGEIVNPFAPKSPSYMDDFWDEPMVKPKEKKSLLKKKKTRKYISTSAPPKEDDRPDVIKDVDARKPFRDSFVGSIVSFQPRVQASKATALA